MILQRGKGLASPDGMVDEIKNRINIVDVIQETVSLKKQGRNFIGLCPFHNEKSPSFSVNEEKQFFHCFGCGESGDALQFLIKLKNLSFRDALIDLGKRVGIDVETTGFQDKEQFKFLLDIFNTASQIYHQTLTKLKDGQPALNYLLNRSINQDSIQKFMLGAALDDWTYLHSHLTQKKFSLENQIKSTLVNQKNQLAFDYFRNRVMFPIFDEMNRIVAFGGRVLDESKPKYLNSPENYYFKKRQILYGLNLAKDDIAKSKSAIVVEGYLDVIMAHQFGFKNTVAPLGTGLTEQHIQKLKRYTNKIVLVFDSDLAGEKAMLRGLTLALKANIETMVVTLPTGLDPCDFLLKFDSQAFADELNKAKSALDYRIELGFKDKDLNNDFHKRQYLTELFAFFNNIESEVLKEEGIKKASRLLNISVQAIQNDYLKTPQPKSPPILSKAKDIPHNIEIRAEQHLLFTLLNHPELYSSFRNKLSEDKFHAPFYKDLYLTIKQVYDEDGELDVFKVQELFQDKKEYGALMDAIFNKEYQQEEPARAIQDCLKWLKLYEIKQLKSEVSKKLHEAKQNKNIDLENELLEERQFLINEEDKIKQHQR